jgi:hypothetical protein
MLARQRPIKRGTWRATEVRAVHYDSNKIVAACERGSACEDETERARALRVELPRESIGRYLHRTDIALAAGSAGARR